MQGSRITVLKEVRTMDAKFETAIKLHADILLFAWWRIYNSSQTVIFEPYYPAL